MAYQINRELEWNQIHIITDSGSSYRIGVNETSSGSNLWILDLFLLSGKPESSEVYKTMSLVYELLTERDGLLERNNITEIITSIQASNRKEIDKKTAVFTRWIKEPWTFEVKSDPVIEIQGRAKKIYLDTNIIHIKKKQQVDKKINDLKFCFSCGTENKSFKFCPNCGQNLQQA